MRLLSPAFKEGEKIPIPYTCNGKNCNPSLQIRDVPPEAVSLALIVDDPDVPERIRQDRLWVHWVVFNIPPSTEEIPENKTPPGVQGTNTYGNQKYQGPCPPDREHRYFFKLYALDCKLSLPAGATKEELLKEMEGHIVAEAQLRGRYEQPKQRCC